MPSRATVLKPKTKELASFDRTTWKADGTPQSGWGQVPYEFWDHIPRLRSGAVQGDLFWYICRLTFGLEPSRRDEGWPEWTPWCRWDDIAERIKSTVRTVQEECHEAVKRAGGPVIAVQEKRGEVRFRLLWRTWSKLPDYKSVPKPVLVIPEKKTEPAKLLEDSIMVRGGRKSRWVEIPGWEKKRVAVEALPGSDCSVSFFLGSDSDLLVKAAVVKAESSEENKPDVKSNRSYSADSISSSSPKEKAKLEVPKLIVEACAAYGLVNDGAILELIANCQSFAPECSLEEIAAEVRRIGGSTGPNVRSIQLLIRAEVPKYFGSSAYKHGIKPATPEPKLSRRELQELAHKKLMADAEERINREMAEEKERKARGRKS